METTQTIPGDSKLKVLIPDRNGFAKEILDIPLELIRPMADQPRKYFDPDKLRELSESLEGTQQAQTGVVRPLDPPDAEGHTYELISGERRFRALKLAGMKYFRAEVDRTPMTSDQLFIRAAMCNSAMEELSPTENALTVQRLRGMGLSDVEIGKILSKSPVSVNQYHRLLSLAPEVFAMMGPDVPEAKRLGFSLGLLLVGIPENIQIALAQEIIDRKLTTVQAKHLIHKSLAGSNAAKYKRPDKQFEMFLNFLTKTHQQLETLLDTPAQDIRTMLVGAVKLQERMRAIEILEQLAKESAEFKEQSDHILGLMGVEREKVRFSTFQILDVLAADLTRLRERIAQVLRDREDRENAR